MVDIIVGKKFIEEYCYHIQERPPYGIAILLPKEEIEKYWDYAVSYGTIQDNNEYTLGKNDLLELSNNIVNVCVYDTDILIFEFPDDYPEEELFYFKLKYC